MLNRRMNKAFQENNGILTSELAEKYDLTAESLRKAYKRGDILKEERGVYVIDSASIDDFYTIQLRMKKGVFSHASAAMLHNLTTFSPFKHEMTFPSGYHFEHKRIKSYHSSKNTIGIITMDSWFGNPIKVTNMERTIIDMLRSTRTDVNVVNETLESYFYYIDEKDRNLERLMDYAKIFRVKKKVEEQVKNMLSEQKKNT